MAYIGVQDVDPQLNVYGNKFEYLTADGVTTTFTLSQPVPGALEQNIQVFINNVPQEPGAAYNISATNWSQLVFTVAPSNGATVYVLHRGNAVAYSQPSNGSVTVDQLASDLKNFTNDTFAGTGAQTAFTLSQEATDSTVLVTINGVTQNAPTNYSVSTTTLTFTSAPANGAVIKVLHLGLPVPFTKALPLNIVKTNNLHSTLTVPVANGGTGATDASTARTNLGAASSATLSSHTGDTNNPHSTTADQVLPTQTGNNGKVLQTNGTTASWQTPSSGISAGKAIALSMVFGG